VLPRPANGSNTNVLKFRWFHRTCHFSGEFGGRVIAVGSGGPTSTDPVIAMASGSVAIITDIAHIAMIGDRYEHGCIAHAN
jgi:hypothetical protein